MRAKFHWECPVGNWKRLGKHWRTSRIISNTVQNANKLHPIGLEKTAIVHFEIKITEKLQEKISNTTNLNVPLLIRGRLIGVRL